MIIKGEELLKQKLKNERLFIKLNYQAEPLL